METKVDKKLKNDDRVIFTLGTHGVTLQTPVEPFSAHEIISKDLDTSIDNARKMMTRAIDREFFVFVSENPRKIAFSKLGFERYLAMKSLEKQLPGAKNTVDDLIRNFYWDYFLECVREREPLLEVRFRDIVNCLGLDFAEAILENVPGIDGKTPLEKINHNIKDVELPVDTSFRPKIGIIDIGKPDRIKVEDARKIEYLGKLIEVEGRVMTQSEVKPRFIVSAHKCQRCETLNYIEQKMGKFTEPFECEKCQRKNCFTLSEVDSEKVDSQEIIIESEQGQVMLPVILDYPLCTSKYWERDAKLVHVVGVLHLREFNKLGLKDFNFVLKANSIKLADNSLVEPPTQEDIALFEEWKKDKEELRRNLIGSVAPHIYGHSEAKNSLSLGLFSDWGYDIPGMASRSSIHVLLLGDPGTAKSQLLEDIARIAPRCIEAQGENSTAAGLTNAAVQINGVWMIIAGQLAKADRGVACIDEIDKLGEQGVTCFHNIMVRQIQIVDKAGIHIEFLSRCALYATANPKGGGHIDRYVPLLKQLGVVSSALFQRFDLVFVFQDVPNREADEKIWEKVHETYNHPSTAISSNRPISIDLYKKYVIYAQSKPAPHINDAASRMLKNWYLQLRGNTDVESSGFAGPVISARSSAALEKITIAMARREMADEATEEHAQMAIDLYKKSLISMGLTGELDYNVFDQGGTQSQIKRAMDLRQCLSSSKSPLKLEDIIKETGYEGELIMSLLRNFMSEGSVVETKRNTFRWIRS